MFRLKRGFTPALIAAVTLLFALPSPVPAQEGSPEDMAAMEAMMAAGQPGEHHKHMAALVGTWDVKARFWMPGSAEAMESSGTATFKMILGGRFLRQDYKGEFMGMPFEGIGTQGYDNISGHYVSTWTDSTSTALMSETGQCDGSGKKYEWHGEMPDPVTGEMTPTRTEQVMEGNDRFTMTSYMTAPDGSEFKSMELVYTRKS